MDLSGIEGEGQTLEDRFVVYRDVEVIYLEHLLLAFKENDFGEKIQICYKRNETANKQEEPQRPKLLWPSAPICI